MAVPRQNATGHDEQAGHEQQEQRQRLQDRVELLKLRTALLGLIGFLLLAMAAVMLLNVGPSAIDAIASVLIGAGSVHTPENLYADLGNTSRMPLILQLSFLAVAALGVSAMSRDGMSALHCKLWLVLLTGLGGSALFIQLTMDGSRASRSPLQSAIDKKDWIQASRLLPFEANPMGAAYVQAQIALAQNDTVGAGVQGFKVLPLVEQVLFRKHADGQPTNSLMYQPTRYFRLDVLRRIDLATYGAAHSELSIALGPGTDSAKSSRVAQIVRSMLTAAAALLALALSTFILMLWVTMVRRVKTVSVWASMAAFTA